MSLVKKYQPDSFDSEYLVKTKPIKELEERVKIDREIPHLLFVGNAGVGKTITAYIIVRELCNLTKDDRIGEYCLDLNASDERGIDTIRGKIKTYAKSRPIYGDKRYVFLDEVDNLTKDAYTALRRIMEDYSDTCTFILSCNYSHKIIKPVKSRCSIYNFPEPNANEIFDVVKAITEKENIKITDDAIHEIILQFDCDVRSIINFIDGHSANLLIEKSDIQIESKSQELIDLVLDSKDIVQISTYFRDTKFDAHTAVSNMLEPINKKLLDHPKYGEIVERLADTVYRVNVLSNTDGKMQLYNFCVWLYNINQPAIIVMKNDGVISASAIINSEKDLERVNDAIAKKHDESGIIVKTPTQKLIEKERSGWDDIK